MIATNTNSITCPNCGQVIPLQEAMERQMQSELDDKMKSERERLQQESNQERKRIRIELEKKQQIDLEKIQRDNQEREERAKAEADQRICEMRIENERARQEAEHIKSENETAMLQKQRELETKEAQLKAEAERQQLENERKLREEQSRLETEIRSKLETESTLKNAENLTLITSLTKKATDLENQLKQTSQQLQGEAQEVVLEDVLHMAFPNDLIEAVPKGYKGADCFQRVRTNGDVLGTIIWESKRTKQWLNEWIGKLKDDQRTANADVAMIVTQSLPSGVKGWGEVEGIWAMEFQYAIPMAAAMRAGIIEVARAKKLSNGSDEKTKVIYQYVTSNEFRLAIQTFTETFISFQDDLAAEKRAMEKQWKKRETTITRALTAVTRIEGSLQGILGDKYETIEQIIDSEHPKQLTT
jgi:hypothetical protein